jgi:flagellar hook-associated protein 2
MAISSSTGLSTGLDIQGLVTQLMSVERQPVLMLQGRQSVLATKKDAFSTLASKLSAFKTQADALANPDKFFPRSVTSSDDSVATAIADPGATRGTYTVTATALARGSIAAATNTKAALTNTIASGSGTFTFRLGASGAAVAVPVTLSTTLEQLVRDINDENAGVRADAINVGTSAAPAWKLTLTSTSTGSANDIVVLTDDTTLAIANTQPAADAQFSITGIGNFTRASNSFSDAIPGVAITLKAGAGSTDLTIGYSALALQATVQGLVNAYNDVVTTVAAQTAGTTNADGTVSPAVLSGEILPRAIVASLRSAITTRTSSAYPTLSDVGIAVKRDGTLSLDATRFKSAVESNPEAVSTLVAGSSTASGIADLLSSIIDGATKSSTGTLAVRTRGIEASIKDMQKQIDAATERLAVRERILRAQFLSLEDTIGKLQQTQSSLTSQLNGLANLSTYLSKSPVR